MDTDHLVRLYDDAYAGTYEERFLTSDLARSDAEYEVALLSRWLRPGVRWLDVACGTGYFLRRFPDIHRAGLDLSPAMLALAERTNPGVQFHNRSFLDPIPEWKDHWDVVSCMWYAYGLVNTMREIEQLVANLARWTAPDGRCFVPLADPALIAGVDLPHRLPSPWPGETTVTAIVWSYVEDGGAKAHAHQLAPHVSWMEDTFRQYFDRVEFEVYPPAMPGWEGRRRALVASVKKV